MTAKYYAILTSQGAAKLANATALGTRLNLTQMAVGDGNGALPTPDPAQTKLINQKRIAPLNMLNVDPENTSQIIAEQIIPENEGGFWIREIGLYDDAGVLIAVANCPETYKPQLQEGSGRTQTIRMILIVSNTEAVTLKIDPAVVLATRKYVDDKVIEVKAYADSLMAAHLAAANAHNQYAPKASPALTGTPTAPTPVKTDNTTKLATTAHVKQVVADYAPLANPALTGKPTAPTAPLTSNDTQLATTEFVRGFLNGLGLGMPAITTVAAFDWQQIDAPSGAIFRVAADNITNMPPGIAFTSGTGVFIRIDGSSSNGTRFSAEVIPDTATDSNYKIYKVLVTGAKAARAFSVRQVFTSTDVIPLACGGLGATTPEGGRNALGFDALGIGLSNNALLSAFDWQQVDFTTGARYLVSSSTWTNAPSGVNYPAGTQVFIAVDGVTSSGTVIELTLTANQANDTNYRIYKVRIANAKGSRTFSVRQVYTSAELVDIVLSGVMSGTIDVNGYITVPMIIGGVKRSLIVQWGQANNVASATTTSVYPVPFPNAVLQVIGCGFQISGNTQSYVVINSPGKTQFQWNGFYASGGGVPVLASVVGSVSCRYIAIGW